MRLVFSALRGSVRAIAVSWLAMVAVGGWTSCSKNDASCANEVLSQDVSPNGSNKAIVFLRHCPGRKDSTNVSVLKAAETLPDGNGNVFADEARQALRVSWRANDSLEILSWSDVSAATRLNQAGSIKVTYLSAVQTDLVAPADSPAPAPK